VFSLANRYVRKHHGPDAALPYDIELVSHHVDAPGGIRTTSGLLLGIDRQLLDPARETDPRDRAIDTVVVVGGEGTQAAMADLALLAWLRHVAPSTRRMASVCSGAFLLAAAGLLNGKRATTHWSECEVLQRYFPEIDVDADPIFVRDGSTYTSAGITAGMDLALALVEEDLGREVALWVSRWLVMFVQRPGGQSQFSSQLSAQLAERQPLRELQAWIASNPAEDLSVAALASRSAMSPRHFARVFREEIGVTPAQYVEDVRVEIVRRLLETTDRSIEHLAREAGFGTVETLQRAFRRALHTTPREYRRHFTRAGASHE